MTDSAQDYQQSVIREMTEFFAEPTAMRTVLVMIFSVIIAYWLSRYVAKVIIRIAQAVSVKSDRESNAVKAQRLREVETYLSVTVAIVRTFIVIITAYVIWRIATPNATQMGNSIAAIGASAFFIVFAGQSLGPVVRDLSAGTVMIAEKWFTIGDFIKIEPFIDVSGVVERLTLRSTKIRTVSGEVVWINNQHMQAVHVSPKGVRTIAVDVFVRDRVKGERALEDLIDTLPTGPTMLAGPLRITYAERWNDNLWRISIIGQTVPGREWIIEKHFVNQIESIDAGVEQPHERLIVHAPISRFADPEVERKFRRVIQKNNRKNKK